MLRTTLTLADIVWPALLFEGRLLAWWVILLGLAVELPFVRSLTGFGLKRCVLADLAMNAASTLIGIVLIPALGLTWFLAAIALPGTIPVQLGLLRGAVGQPHVGKEAFGANNPNG